MAAGVVPELPAIAARAVGAGPALARACGSPQLGVTAYPVLVTEDAMHVTCYNEHTC